MEEINKENNLTSSNVIAQHFFVYFNPLICALQLSHLLHTLNNDVVSKCFWSRSRLQHALFQVCP